MSFAVSVKQWTDRTQREQVIIIRKIALELFTRVIMRSPVRTGRFRGNWQTQIGSPVGGVLDTTDKDGRSTVAEAGRVVNGWNAENAVFMSNNVEYAGRIEDGWSGQASQGVVKITMQEHPQIVEQEASE